MTSTPLETSSGNSEKRKREDDDGDDHTEIDKVPRLLIAGDPNDPYNNLTFYEWLDDVIFDNVIKHGAKTKANEPIERVLKSVHEDKEYMKGRFPNDTPGAIPTERLASRPLMEYLASEMSGFKDADFNVGASIRWLNRFFCNHRRKLGKDASFKGNINYVRFFRDETSNFVRFSPPLYNRFRKTSGNALWTPNEKDRFFQLLSRYSIHRIDDISAQLPKKSKVQIMSYYNLLRKTLRKYKHDARLSKKLVPMSEMPIAFEMEPEFIKFEESQSKLMAGFARERFTYSKSESSLLTHEHIYPDIPGLINWDHMTELARLVFQIQKQSSGQLFERKWKSSDRPSITALARIYIKDLVGLFVNKLLLNICEHKLASEAVLCLNNPDVSVRISENDIRRESVKLTGRSSKLVGFARSIMSPLENILGNQFKEKLSFENQQDLEKLKFKKVKPRNASVDLKKPLDFNTAVKNAVPLDKLQYMPAREKLISTVLGRMDEDSDYEDEEEDEIIDVKRDPVVSDCYDEKDVDFVVDEVSDVKHMELGEKLFLMETSLLERLDYEASVKYERLVLGYMMCKSSELRSNDLKMTRYYVDNKYYPKKLPLIYDDETLDSLEAKKQKKVDQGLEDYRMYEEVVKKRDRKIKEAKEAVLKLENDLETVENRSLKRLGRELDKAKVTLARYESMTDVYQWMDGPLSIDNDTGAIKIPLGCKDGQLTCTYYNEDNPYETTVFDDVTDDMLLKHNYQYSTYR